MIEEHNVIPKDYNFLGYVETSLCLIWIIIWSDIKVLKFLIRDFLRFSPWSRDLGENFLALFFSPLWIRCVRYKYRCFILGLYVLFGRENCTATLWIIFLKIVKSLQLCKYRRITEPHNFLCCINASVCIIFFLFLFVSQKSKNLCKFPT